MTISFLNRNIYCLAIVWFLLIPIACSGGQMDEQSNIGKYEKLSDVPDSVWKEVSEKEIFFGHQSVGYNILEGVREIEKEHSNIKLAIEETFDPDTFKPNTLSHYQIGYNGNPKSKIDMFSFIARSGGAKNADILLFKFCYVDFNAETDVDALFKLYKETFDKLKSKYSNKIFIHCTVPLTDLQSGPKAMIKKLIGRPVNGIIENAKRCHFNELIRKNYTGKEPIFDIAAVESTFPDGKRATYEYKGSSYSYLVPSYTDDGGHLNEQGRKVVASKFLLSLALTSK